jgi:rod shape determining protein RodA
MEIGAHSSKLSFLDEFKMLFLILSVILTASILGQLSSSNGEFEPHVQKHLLNIVIGLMVMFGTYKCDFRIWYSFAYLFYVFAFILLVLIKIAGITKLGACRWIDLYFLKFQPSELMKIFLILALSRYYSLLTYCEMKNIVSHIIPILLIVFPTILILKQPDLGTAILLFSVGLCIMFFAGFPKRILSTLGVLAIIVCPFCWHHLHDYQKNRILTFMDPDRDPFGSGYHILQSKIAIGSGYFFGKGFLFGTQSKLNFLPEKNTDFIFTSIAEESGFVGSCFIIFMFLLLTSYFFWAGSRSKTVFSKLLSFGLGMLLFLHVFVNIAMVIGIVPVVGIPLPFLSYGGSSIIVFMMSCGLIMSVMSNRRMY